MGEVTSTVTLVSFLCDLVLAQGPWDIHGGGEAHRLCGRFCGEGEQADLRQSLENQVRTEGVYLFLGASGLYTGLFHLPSVLTDHPCHCSVFLFVTVSASSQLDTKLELPL